MAKRTKPIITPSQIGAQQGDTAYTVNKAGTLGVQQGNTRLGANPVSGEMSLGQAGGSGNTAYDIGVGMKPGQAQPDISAAVSQRYGNLTAGADTGSATGNTPGANVAFQGNGVSANAGSSGAGAQGQRQIGDNTVGLGVGLGRSGSASVTPTVQIGQGAANQGGAQIGSTVGGGVGSMLGPAGSFVGSGIGSAAGSVIGGAFQGGAGRDAARRQSTISAFQKAGAWGKDGTLALPDGSTFNVNAQDMRNWSNPNAVAKGQNPNQQLHPYDIDYTNDTDFVAGMGGTALSRLLAGGTGKAIDQTGALIGNQTLGSVGHGAQLTQDNFNKLMSNQRAVYAQQGIQNKDEMLTLANKAYGDGRINEFDHSQIQQVASMMYDNNYGMTQQLMAGRQNGVETALKSPQNGSASAPDGVSNGSTQLQAKQAPVMSLQEAFMRQKPFFDWYKQNYVPKVPSNTGAQVAQGIGLGMAGLGAIGNIYRGVTGNSVASALGQAFKPSASTVGQYGVGNNAQNQAGDVASGDFGWNTGSPSTPTFPSSGVTETNLPLEGIGTPVQSGAGLPPAANFVDASSANTVDSGLNSFDEASLLGDISDMGAGY